MINDILDFTQITNGKLKLNEVEFEPCEVVKEVTKLLKRQAKNKGLAIEFVDLVKCLSPKYRIKNDPQRLKQVLLNLLGNALKFTSAGKIVISAELQPQVELDPSNQRKQVVKFSVIDSGCGIRAEDIPKLFKLFGKLGDNRSLSNDNNTGIGLGLAISQILVKLMNNCLPGEEIEVESEYGKGSNFHFRLGSCDELDKEKEKKNEKSSFHSSFFDSRYDEEIHLDPKIPKFPLHQLSPSEELPKIRALLVDDDQMNILVLTKFFNTFEDCEYDVAFNGKEAVELICSKAQVAYYYEIILMDLNMPEMNGFEASRNIMKMVKEKRIPDVAIVAATANVSFVDSEKCFSHGMVDYICKPFTRAMVREVISKQVKRKKK